MENAKRIEILRTHALNRRQNNIEWQYFYEKGYIESYPKEVNLGRRAAMAVYNMLSSAEPAIDEGELIAGKPCGRELSESEAAEMGLIGRYSIPAKPRQDGQSSHMAIDYEKLLNLGTSGIKKEIAKKISKLDISRPQDLEKYEFYQSAETALDGVEILAQKYSGYAKKLAGNCEDAGRKKELLKIAEICENVPKNPARTFYEAVQAVHFVTFCISIYPTGLYQLGRPDRYLYKYYKKDLRDGVITESFAQLLLDCLGILYNEYIPSGLAVGYMVGGRDENGKTVENELTRMCILSIRHIKMIYPGVGLCYTPETSPELLRLSCEILGEGHSHPALFNDDVITKGLRYYGTSRKDACHYIHSTCVEITPAANSAVWVASPYTNLPQLLLDTIGAKNGNANAFDAYKELEDALFERLSESIKNNLIEQNRLQIERTHRSAQPLVSCFVNDCIKKGKDIEQGGARYNSIMPSFVGVANLADSLHVIEKTVFTDKKFTLYELMAMLGKNYEGYEPERAYITNKITKYGNDDETADAYVEKITGFIWDECKKYTTYRGGRLIPSLFCWVMHEHFGTRTIATPDGRKKGFPLGDGSGPSQGSEKNGPTSAIISSTKWEHYPFIGGIAVNMKFSKKLLTGEYCEKMEALIKTFMAGGGFELQINAADKETLVKAQKTPELYADLVVRIGGYSDYFTRLSAAMQQEIIERAEHII